MTDRLSNFGYTFQIKAITSLLTDKIFLQQISDILIPSYFESEANQWVVETILDYSREYKASPSLEVMKVKMVDIDDAILAPLQTKDFTGFIKMGMEYADLVVKGGEVSEELTQLIEDFSKDKKFEISIEAEEQAHEELFGIYNDLAG